MKDKGKRPFASGYKRAHTCRAPGDGALPSSNRISLLGRRALIALLAAVLTACASLPTDVPIIPSTAFANGNETAIGRLFAPQALRNPAQSGFAILDTGHDALRARLAAIAMAEQAVDLQYYIWNSDYAGRLMAHSLILAANRGVRVRLLLDDFTVGDRDTPLSVMDAHPHIELRVYNPFAGRTGMAKGLDMVGEFDRLNQRMHNKSFIVDGSVAIVGGRNIGDEYFDLGSELNFRDRDMLVIGPLVGRLGDGFDAYWNSGRSFPISTIVKGSVTEGEYQSRVAALSEHLRAKPALAYEVPSSMAAGRKTLEAWRESLVWARAEVLIDIPPALDDTASDEQKQVARGLSAVARNASKEILIESAYFVLGAPEVANFGEIRDRGVTVKALTNSLASNDVTANHAAYARRRSAMLKGGVDIYEFRPDAASCQSLLRAKSACTGGARFGLHAKSVVFDRQTVFVGSFNLNLRSAYLNSELGILVHSPELAQRVARDIEQNMKPENSWRVMLGEQGSLRWIDERGGVVTYYDHEPETGFWRRFRSGFLSLLPIEKYL